LPPAPGAPAASSTEGPDARGGKEVGDEPLPAQVAEVLHAWISSESRE